MGEKLRAERGSSGATKSSDTKTCAWCRPRGRLGREAPRNEYISPALPMALTKESFLPGAKDCAETWRFLRRPDGPECVECHAASVMAQDQRYRGHLRRYTGRPSRALLRS